MRKDLIAASILSADFLKLGDELDACRRSGADWIHVDVMDGRFVPNITLGPVIVEACRRGVDLPLDVHLMIERPEDHLEAFAAAGATGLTVHIESCPHPEATLEQIRKLGCRAGVSLSPDTPIGRVEPVLATADLVLVMSVHPGYAGQRFMPEVLARLQAVRALLDACGSQADLEVDGGINAATLPQTRRAGANVFVAASAIFNHPGGPAAGIQALREALS